MLKAKNANGAAIKKKKKVGGIVELKSRYGYICVSPWIFGLVVFFILPIFKSFFYSFCEVKLQTGGMKLKWLGLANFKYAFAEEANYTDYLGASVGKFAYSFPIILILSLILALLLDQKFKGRTFFRSLYFLPVIIASGVVLGTILGDTNIASGSKTDASILSEMINVSQIIDWLGLPDTIGKYFTSAISGIMNLIWNCGIQIVLFISGMQSIPDLYHEVAKVEGATAWEEFWLVTLPSLSRVTVLVGIFTMVELMTSQTDKVIKLAYTYMESQSYGQSSAMLWIYFGIIGVIMATCLLLYNRFCARKWE